MSRITLFILFSTLSLLSFGQSKSETTNRAVFNKIEFFINTQLTDSIYNLGSTSYKEKVSADELAYTLNNIYQLGRIRNVEVIDFKGTTATYSLEFDEYIINTKFALDSTFHFDLFSLLPAEKKKTALEVEENPTEEEVDLVNVQPKSPTRLFIDSVADNYIKKEHSKSLTIAVFNQNKYETFVYGDTAVATGSVASDTTLYEIGSLTKIFTAILLGDLVTKEVVSLEDSIAKFLPDSVASNPSIQGITFKQLANHTSGLPKLAGNMEGYPEYNPKDPYANYKRSDLFNFLKAYQADQEQAGTYNYSDVGFGLLGELISIIKKKPYFQCVEEIILKPLKMTNTTDKSKINAKELARGYDEQGQLTNSWNFDAMVGSMGLKSTARDLMALAVEQFKMPENDFQYAMALTRQFTTFTPENTDIGLAWQMSMLDGLIYFHHSGTTGGFSSFIGISPDTKTAVVVLSNSLENVDGLSKLVLEALINGSNR